VLHNGIFAFKALINQQGLLILWRKEHLVSLGRTPKLNFIGRHYRTWTWDEVRIIKTRSSCETYYQELVVKLMSLHEYNLWENDSVSGWCAMHIFMSNHVEEQQTQTCIYLLLISLLMKTFHCALSDSVKRIWTGSVCAFVLNNILLGKIEPTDEAQHLHCI
jgi:hypothetical protein